MKSPFWHSPSGIELLTFIKNEYSHPSRHYHDFSHLSYVLNHLQTLAGELSPEDFIKAEFALMFHDIVMDFQRKDNEQQSARVFEEKCRDFLKPEDVQTIKRLIEFTDYSKTNSSQDFLVDLIRDIDLSILGEDEDVYEKYTWGIRAEYSHIEDAIFYPERAKILKMLKREMIFKTRHFTHLNKKAQLNINQELSQIENQISSSRPS